MCFSLLCRALGLLLMVTGISSAALNTNYVIHKKHAASVTGYFSTPHQIKAKNFWKTYKIIDDTILTTIPVATQVEFAASTETADVYVPVNYSADRPIGIYIHMNAGDSAYMPSGYQSSLNDLYLIGASPDHAGNSRHDPWRIARALDLVASLKDQYNVDDERIYIGGFSGGALISILAGMIYPDVFKGVTPTEHVMYQDYWGKIYTQAEINAMANNNQRWSFIIGADYASWWFTPKINTWKSHGFNTQQTTVAGMAHQQPSSSNLNNALFWVDAPVQRQRCKTYEEWLTHCFDSSHSTINRGALDDFDFDGTSNLREYVFGRNPVVADASPATSNLRMDGSKSWFYYRRAALDAPLQVATSTDLMSWDETGNLITEASVNYDSDAFADCSYESSNPSPILFFKAKNKFITLTNLTQIPGAAATQLTTGWNGPPELAIDGNRDPEMNNGSVTHTDTTSANWWQVDLDSEHPIYRISLFNRNNNQNRLSNFRISVLDASGSEVVGKNFHTTVSHVANFMHWDLPDSTQGKTVKISQLGSNHQGNTILSFAEVEVIGPTPDQ